MELTDFTFIVYNKSTGKSGACSRRGLNSWEELKKELEYFNLCEPSVEEVVERFNENKGVLENEFYRLTLDNVYYGN